MYKIRLGEVELGSSSLETGDPPMGVASGLVELSCEPGNAIVFLTDLGAITDSSDLLVITNNPKLNVYDESGTRVESEFCYLAYCDELKECVFDACAIPWDRYENRFPDQHAEYYSKNS